MSFRRPSYPASLTSSVPVCIVSHIPVSPVPSILRFLHCANPVPISSVPSLRPHFPASPVSSLPGFQRPQLQTSPVSSIPSDQRPHFRRAGSHRLSFKPLRFPTSTLSSCLISASPVFNAPLSKVPSLHCPQCKASPPHAPYLFSSVPNSTLLVPDVPQHLSMLPCPLPPNCIDGPAYILPIP